jgi:hypothetical protein
MQEKSSMLLPRGECFQCCGVLSLAIISKSSSGCECLGEPHPPRSLDLGSTMSS